MSSTMITPEQPEQAVAKPVSRIHPLVAAAAVSVIVLAGTGVATMTGLIGKPSAQTGATEAPAAQAAAESSAQASAQSPMQSPAPASAARSARATPARPAAHADASQAMQAAQPAANPREWATVENTRAIKVQGKSSGVGMVAGGVLGGVLGNQVGKGNGRTVGTVLGAVGGGYAGNEIEKHAKSTMRYELTVRYDDGSTRTFTRSQPWAYRVGERLHMGQDGQIASRAPAAGASGNG